MKITADEALLIVTWFERKLNDTPEQLQQKEYQLAQKLFKAGGLAAPTLIKVKAEKPDW